MHAPLFDQLHPDWREVLLPYAGSVAQIEGRLLGTDFTPTFSNIFRSLTRSIESTKVVIVGQDPYPAMGHAHGLSFSVAESVSPLPPSLKNIFTELLNDCGIDRKNGDLSDWFDQGVMLLNRVLTTQTGSSLSHSGIGWQEITDAVARVLGERQVVAILWGKSAGELARYFSDDWCIKSVHPSPLSAYRGFFGSKPFSKCNGILESNNVGKIFW